MSSRAWAVVDPQPSSAYHERIRVRRTCPHCGLSHGPLLERCPVTGAPREGDSALVLDERYRLVTVIGEGATGRVHRGTDLRSGEEVAVKILRVTSETARDRMRREAREGARVRSVHVVRCLDEGIDGAIPYVVMELVEGGSLRERLRGGPMALADVRALADAMLRGLGAIHEAGLVHRDVKPSNLLLRAGRAAAAAIADLGLVTGRPADRLTASGELLGTPGYISPEQARGRRDVDARSDLWSAGAVLWEAAAGRPPYGARSAHEQLVRLVSAPPPPLAAAARAPPALDAALRTAMARPREARFASAEQMRRAVLDALA